MALIVESGIVQGEGRVETGMRGVVRQKYTINKMAARDHSGKSYDDKRHRRALYPQAMHRQRVRPDGRLRAINTYHRNISCH